MIADVVAGLERHLMKAIEHHQNLRRRQSRMQSQMDRLDAEIQTAQQTKLLIEMNLQAARQAEWELSHPVREAATQVKDFQLAPLPSMTLPIIVQTPPASP